MNRMKVVMFEVCEPKNSTFFVLFVPVSVVVVLWAFVLSKVNCSMVFLKVVSSSSASSVPYALSCVIMVMLVTLCMSRLLVMICACSVLGVMVC